jgi:DNA-binding NarL/FixJ family response regulator
MTTSDTRPATPAVSLMIIEDHAVTRDGLRMMLEAVGFRVVGEAGDADAAELCFKRCKPEITLLDIRLGLGPDGIHVAAALRQIDPQCKIIMFASDALEADIHRARKAGACGFLVKTQHREDIIRAILEAHRSGICHPYDFAPAHPHEPLTEREIQVLDELRRGLTSAEIGRVLHLSEHTVKTHLKNIFTKLHAADRAEAVAAGFQLGYLRVN